MGIGIQNFEKILGNNYFYIDKTDFIREWWDSGDDVTLITRPRRFGKTLTLSMVEHFFSNHYNDHEKLFGGLSIWQDEKMRCLAGKFPVISLSFADIKESSREECILRICDILSVKYRESAWLLTSDQLTNVEKLLCEEFSYQILPGKAASALKELCRLYEKQYGEKVILLLDEYDTPMQEAWVI